LNKTLEVKYDSFNVPKGKDAKKFFELRLEQYSSKTDKGSYFGFGGQKKSSDSSVEPVYFQIDRGNKDLQDIIQISYVMGQPKDNGKFEKRFDTWYKKLSEIQKQPLFTSSSKEYKENLKKINHLMALIENLMKEE